MNDLSHSNWFEMSDVALAETIGKFIQHHRLNQNKSQEFVATQAGISRSTLSLMERGERVNLGSLLQVLRTLDLLYVMDVFKISTQINPLAYHKLLQKTRKNASGKNHLNEPGPEELGW